MNAAGLRRQDTTKGPPLRILSLGELRGMGVSQDTNEFHLPDGGGVRGYSMFIMLQELMHRTYVEIHGDAPRRDEIPKPCDHFDLIAGTGTGGLIAIMLGRLRLDLETCMSVYVRMTKKVFETDKTIAGIPYRSTLFKASKLEEAIRECVKEHTVFEDEGNDSLSAAQDISTPVDQMMAANFSGVIDARGDVQRSLSTSSRPPDGPPRSFHGPGRWGDSDALLYDIREHRTKTCVAASSIFAKLRLTVLARSQPFTRERLFPADLSCYDRTTHERNLHLRPIVQSGKPAERLAPPDLPLSLFKSGSRCLLTKAQANSILRHRFSMKL